jgi:hypothetical protein
MLSWGGFCPVDTDRRVRVRFHGRPAVNLKTVPHRIAQGCGVCLPLFLIVGLLVPGCAGKRTDMLSSLIKPKQSDDEASLADEESTSDGDSSALVAGADNRLDNARLSAFSDEEIIEGRPKLRTRVRSLFSRDDALTGGDPFLDDEKASGQQQPRSTAEDRQAIASSEGSLGEESLASFQTKPTDDKEPISDVRPWWETGDSAEDRKGITGSESARVDELLASFQTRQAAGKNTTAEAQPWWEAGSPDSSAASSTMAPTTASVVAAETPQTTFSRQFDSRLERLRAELRLDDNSVAAAADGDEMFDELRAGHTAEQGASPQQSAPASASTNPVIAARDSLEQANPFASTSERSQELPIVAGNGEVPAEQAYPSLMTQPRQPVSAPESADGATASADGSLPLDARSRVQALMDEAQQDWAALQLESAYRTAVAAHDLATRENVQFRNEEVQPFDLARKIAADRDRDAVATTADQSAEALASNPFNTSHELGIGAAGTPFGFEELDRLANPWTDTESDRTTSRGLADPNVARTATQQQADTDEPIVASQTSGVSLLPPDDDFPSDAAERDWAGADPRDIRLATHRFPEFSRPGDQQIREQMSGLSAEDNQALLQSVADQKSRVLRSKGIQWPELPAARQPTALGERSSGPIQVAQAPRFSLEDDMAIATAPEQKWEGTPGSGGSLLGQIWRSQPIWFIGGLILLIVALRLWPWPKKEEA